MPPPRIWMPNFPLRLRLKPPPMVQVAMPEQGTEGTFKTKHLVFETVPQITKLEIGEFLRNVYGIEVVKVNSLVIMGRRRNEDSNMPRHGKDFKRFYVRLGSEVELPNVPRPLDKVKNAASSSSSSSSAATTSTASQ
eukprot:GFKZ01003256.1.p1 GENE.GFKZ01003256.1~~GFKZ01003256.1.p1  ORF type:complete len:137 (+),score=18.28 GFKZ01003256.1:159-569(+)